jgi:hypothetical protein
MLALRWVIAVFIALNALSGVLLALRAVALKRRPQTVSGKSAVNALLASLSWPLVGLWIASMTAFLASAVFLILAEPAALVTFVLALTLNLAMLWKAHEEINGRSSRTGEMLSRCVLFGLLFLAGNGIRASLSEPHAGSRLQTHAHADVQTDGGGSSRR